MKTYSFFFLTFKFSKMRTALNSIFAAYYLVFFYSFSENVSNSSFFSLSVTLQNPANFFNFPELAYIGLFLKAYYKITTNSRRRKARWEVKLINQKVSIWWLCFNLGNRFNFWFLGYESIYIIELTSRNISFKISTERGVLIKISLLIIAQYI